MIPSPTFPHEEFLAKWLSGELSDAEWEAWKAQAGPGELEKIVMATAQWEVPAQQSKEEAWSQLTQKLAPENTETPVVPLVKRRIWMGWVAAASIVLIAGLALLFRDTNSVFKTGIGEKMVLLLPDQSEVTLNASSTLSYDESNWSQNRAINLDGEAYFKVEKGQQFTVHTSRGNVKVLGTRFNVMDRPEKWEVQCFSGKVEVSLLTEGPVGPSVVLEKGQSTRINDKRLEMGIPLSEPLTKRELWTDHYVSFEDVPLSAVIAELERQYPVQVVLPAELSSEEHYTGGFPHNNVENALELVFGTWNYLPILEEDGRVRLSPIR